MQDGIPYHRSVRLIVEYNCVKDFSELCYLRRVLQLLLVDVCALIKKCGNDSVKSIVHVYSYIYMNDQ